MRAYHLLLIIAVAGLLLATATARGAVPADAVDATILLSNKKKLSGKTYLTRGKLLRLFDQKHKQYRDFKLNQFSRLTVNCTRKRVEREWYFKEEGNPEKMYTGRHYPRLDFTLTASLKKNRRKLIFNIPKGQPIYLQPAKGKKKRFILQPFLRGRVGQTPRQLVYIKEIIFARPDEQQKVAENKTVDADQSKASSDKTDNRDDEEATVEIEKQTANEKTGKQEKPQTTTGQPPEKKKDSNDKQKKEPEKVTAQDEEHQK